PRALVRIALPFSCLAGASRRRRELPTRLANARPHRPRLAALGATAHRRGACNLLERDRGPMKLSRTACYAIHAVVFMAAQGADQIVIGHRAAKTLGIPEGF